MALEVDSSTDDAMNGVTSNTFSHTCTGSDRVLFVGVLQRFADAVTGVTYNGVALTSLGSVNNADNLVSASLWRLIAPATGANDVVVSLSTSRNGECIAVSFTGADQTDPDGTPVTGHDSADGGFTSPSLVVSSATGEIVLDFVGLQNDDGTSTLTAGADQEELENATDGGATAIRAGSSVEAGAGSVTMSWTPDAADDWAGIAVAVIPASAPSATGHIRQPLLGVG